MAATETADRVRLDTSPRTTRPIGDETTRPIGDETKLSLIQCVGQWRKHKPVVAFDRERS